MTTPLFYLNRQPGWLADWISFSQFYDMMAIQQDPAKQMRVLDDLIDSYDVFVWARTWIRDDEDAFETAAYTFNRMRAKGKKIIYETDDDMTNRHREVAAGDSTTLPAWSDAVTVTTPYLAETMQEVSKRPTYVLPNMLDPLLWKPESSVALDRDKIRISLTGSKTHIFDWKVLAGVLQRIGQDYPNVRILLGAFHPDYLKDVPNVEFVPALPYQLYLDLIKNSDIVLAPVDPDDKFNDGKSPIKAVEGMGATRNLGDELGGAAVIATNNKVYQLAIEDRKTGLLVDQTPEAWEKAIREVLDNAELRRSLQVNGYRHVWKNYNLASEWVRWAKAYQRVLQQQPNKIIMDHVKSYASYRKSVGGATGNRGYGHGGNSLLPQNLSVVNQP